MRRTILIISANRFFRESLLHLFRTDKGLRVLGAVDFSPLICEEVARLGPEIVALTPESDDTTFRATRAIHEAAPATKILMVGMRDDVDVFVKAVRAGAVGYLAKDASPKRILGAAHCLGRNCVVCSPHYVWALFHLLSSPGGVNFASQESISDLTHREQEVATLLFEGLGNKQIADRLNLSLGTVKIHVHNILHKTQSKNRVQLAQVARA